MAKLRAKKTMPTKNVKSKSSPVAELRLPDSAREARVNPSDLIALIYGRAGIGKSTLASEWPGALFFSFEKLSRHLRVPDFNWENGGVTSWSIMKKGVALLKRTTKYHTIVIDTVDRAYLECLDFVSRKHGIEHPSDETHGKAWHAVRSEFENTLADILRTGRTIVFISHSKEMQVEAFSGGSFTRIRPSCSGQCYNVLEGLTDIVLYFEYVRVAGKLHRVIITQGDEIFDAKSPVSLPMFIPVPKGRGFETLTRAFNGEDVGVDPAQITAGQAATRTVKEVINRAKRTQAAKKHGIRK